MKIKMCKKSKDPHKLSVSALAIVAGVLWGAYLFLAALLASTNIETLWFSSKTFALAASIYPGLEASVTGAFIGLLWGLACGAFCGGLFGAFYNFVIDKTKFAKRI
jgi:hypothetical protein